MKRRGYFVIPIIVFLFFYLIVIEGQSQQVIAIHDFNHQLLEQAIKDGIDSVRLTKKLPPLQWDSLLSMAARDQSAYMRIKKIVSHNQRSRKKRWPDKRVKFYGGEGYGVGENVAMIPLYSTVPKNIKKQQDLKQEGVPYAKTYKQAANWFVINWVNSKGHYANIINPAYTLTGLGVSIDKVHHTVYATQVFSMPNENAAVWSSSLRDSALLYLRFRKRAIKPRKRSIDYKEGITYKLAHFDSICNACALDFSRGTEITTIGNKIFLSTYYGTQAFIESLNKKTDGYAAEVVNYSAFSIGNNDWDVKPTRRNGQSLKSGRITPPFYRKRILYQLKNKPPFRGKFGRKLFRAMMKGEKLPQYIYQFPIKVQIGEIPVGFEPGGINEINTVFIRDGRICKVTHGSRYCGEDFKIFKKLPYQSDFEYGHLKFDTLIDSISIDIPFERNSFNFKKPAFTSTIKNKALFQKEIIDIRSEIHASVEGTNAINHELIKRRTEFISKYVLETFPRLKYSIDTTVAWDPFYRLVRKNSAYRTWGDLKQGEIVKKLNEEPIPAEIDTILYETRKTKLVIRFKATEIDTATILYDRLNAGLRSVRGKKEIPYDQVRELNIIFGRLHNLAKRGKFDIEKLLQVSIPRSGYLVSLQNSQNYLLLQHYKNPSVNQLNRISKKLKMVGNELKGWQDNIAIYNLLNFSVEHYGTKVQGLSLDRMIELFNKFTGANRDSLGMNLHFLSSWYFGKDKKNWEKRDKSVNYLYSFYKNKPMTDEFANRISKKYLFSHSVGYAVATLKPYALKENPNHETLVNYLKAAYSHYEDPEFLCFYDPNYVKNVLWASIILSPKEWCGMIAGKCNISFQLLDFEEIKTRYCEICEERDDEILRGIEH